MPENKKIKRYKKIYTAGDSLRRYIIRGLGTIAGLGVLGFIGWSAYGPVMDYLSGISFDRPDPPSASVTSTVEQQSGDDNGTNNGQPSAEQDPGQQVSATPNASAQVKGAYIPHQILVDPDRFQNTLDSYAKDGVNTILIDLKNESGLVLYKSALPAVERLAAQNDVTYDLAAICDAADKKGIAVMGRLHAYCDPVAASRLESAGIKYVDSDFLWIDNAKENGGKPWLNPYSEIAQGYITDLAQEAASAGVSEIVLASLQFPSGFSQEYCSYGETGGKSKPQVLSDYISGLEAKLKKSNTSVSVSVRARDVLAYSEMFYGGSNALTNLGDRIILDVSPSQFGGGFESGKLTLTEPTADPKKTVAQVLASLSSDLKGKETIALIEGDFTASSEQITALEAEDVKNHIVYEA